jgi:hypothetical protein
MTSMDELISLIGQTMDSPAVQAFLKDRSLSRSKPGDAYDPKRYLKSTAEGYSIRHRKGKRGKIDYLWLHLEPPEGYLPFRGPLSRGLRADLGQDEVRQLWGEPSRSGDSDKDGKWLWDRFDSEAVCVHIGYAPGGVGIRMITLMAPDVAR